jgi:hypothetical protein
MVHGGSTITHGKHPLVPKSGSGVGFSSSYPSLPAEKLALTTYNRPGDDTQNCTINGEKLCCDIYEKVSKTTKSFAQDGDGN